MGDIPKRLVRHPAVVAVVDHPPAGGERAPARIDPGRPPQVAIAAFVVDPFPAAVLLKRVGIVANGLGQIGCRLPAGLQALGPDAVAIRVPIIPGSIHSAVALRGFPAVGYQGGSTLAHLVLVAGFFVHKIDNPAYSNHFQGLVTHVQVKGRIPQGHHVAKGSGDLDHPVHAAIVEPRQTGGHVHGGGVLVQGDQFDLGVLADPHPGTVGHDELGLGLVVGVKGVFQTKGRILDRQHPVFFLFDIAQQLAFNVGDAADQNGLGSGGPDRGRNNGQDGGKKQKNGQAQCVPQRDRSHGVFLDGELNQTGRAGAILYIVAPSISTGKQGNNCGN